MNYMNITSPEPGDKLQVGFKSFMRTDIKKGKPQKKTLRGEGGKGLAIKRTFFYFVPIEK